MKELMGYLNTGFVDQAEMKVSVYDEWLNQGLAVFEMTRSFRKKTHQLEEHLTRLYHGMTVMGIPAPCPFADMLLKCQQVESVNHDALGEDDEHRLMITVSPGPRPIYEALVPKGPTLAIADFPLRYTVKGMGPLYETGVALETSPIQAYPLQALPSSIKHRSRAHFALAARRNPWSVLLDQHGYLTEGPGFGLLIVSAGKLMYPPTFQSLPSISRWFLMNLAVKRGLETYVQNLDRVSLLAASEVMVTGTPFCVLPVTRFDGTEIGTGRPGPVYRRLLQDWSDTVKVDIAKQVQSWD